MNPAGAAGRVAEPAVALEALVKFKRFKKNSCHARVGLWVWSIMGAVGIR